MPTVIHVVEATFAGVGRHVLDLVEAQTRRGFDVHVVAGVTRESASFARARRQLTDVTWHGVAMQRSPAPSDLRVRRLLRRLVGTAQPDVLHGHSTKGGLLARSIRSDGLAVVYTPHAPYAMNPALTSRARGAAAAMERALALRTDAVVAVSPEEASFLATIGLPESKIHIVPNGIAPVDRADNAKVRRYLGLPEDRPVIGFVGRLEPQKAPEELMKIFEGVAKRHPAACFAVVGTGSMRPLLLEAAARPPLQGRMHIVGHQDGPWAMSAFDVLVLPSRYEGFPYVLLEAASLGLPSVVSDRATSTLLERGPATVRSIPVGDTASFVAEVEGLLARGLASRLTEAERVASFGVDRRFTIGGMTTDTTTVYEAVSASWSRSASPSSEAPKVNEARRNEEPEGRHSAVRTA